MIASQAAAFILYIVILKRSGAFASDLFSDSISAVKRIHASRLQGR